MVDGSEPPLSHLLQHITRAQDPISDPGRRARTGIIEHVLNTIRRLRNESMVDQWSGTGLLDACPKELPLVRYAFERVRAARFEGDTGSGNEVFHGP